MLDAQKVNEADFKQVSKASQRGAIVGVDGHPGRTQAGEFTIVASEFHLLAECP